MDTKPMRQFLHILIITLGLLIIGCTGLKKIVPTATLAGLLNESEAIEAALRMATINQPEIEVTQVKPTNIQARQTTLAQAFQENLPGSTLPLEYAPSAPVWVITMEGEWKDGFPLPTGTNTPEPYHHFFVILDAKSGSEISLEAFR